MEVEWVVGMSVGVDVERLYISDSLGEWIM